MPTFLVTAPTLGNFSLLLEEGGTIELQGVMVAGVVTAVTATFPVVSSGGPTPNISLAASGVAPGLYTYATVSVDALGRVVAAANGVPPVTAVTATFPLVSSGGLTPNLTLALSGVAPGLYTNATVSVDGFGRVVAAASGAAPANAPIQFAVGTAATTSSATNVTAGQAIRRMTWYPSAAYSPGTTLAVTIGATTFVAAGTFDVTQAGLVGNPVDIAPQNNSWANVPATGPITVTLTGGPVVGSGTLAVDYGSPTP